MISKDITSLGYFLYDFTNTDSVSTTVVTMPYNFCGKRSKMYNSFLPSIVKYRYMCELCQSYVETVREGGEEASSKSSSSSGFDSMTIHFYF